VWFATAGPGATAYTWWGAAPGGTYFFRATATNAIGESDPSNTAAVTTPSPQFTGPVTSLHYAPNANFVNGQYVPAPDGFNLADTRNLSDLNSLPDGDKTLVWLGMGDGVTSAFQSAVQPFIGNSKVYGFYLYDEPDPTGKYKPLVTAANLKAESDWIHANDPGAKTFILLLNLGPDTSPSYANSYNPANTDIDLFGLDPYPAQPLFSGGVNYDIIPAAVTAAEAAGIPLSQVVPVYQAFGGGDFSSWTLPTADQEQQVLATWAAVVPQPAFDYAYSWETQDGDSALVNTLALQSVLAAHNAASTAAAPPSPAATTPSLAVAPGQPGRVPAPAAGPVPRAGGGQPPGIGRPAPLAGGSLPASVVLVSSPNRDAAAQPGVDPPGAAQAGGVPGAGGALPQAARGPAAAPGSAGAAGSPGVGQLRASPAAEVSNGEDGVGEDAGADLGGIPGLLGRGGRWLEGLPSLLRRAGR
jgi:hypothetical protein